MKDLCLLVADSNMSQTMAAALARPEALGIRPITFEINVHPNRDGGIRTTGQQVLSLQNRFYNHALLLLDFEGSGTKLADSLALEAELDRKLHPHWGTNAKAIAIEPELEIWLWGTDNALREALNWTAKEKIREWLLTKGIQFLPNNKPVRPKEAFEKLLNELRQPRSSSLYRSIASLISLRRCTDNSFHRLRTTLLTWFPVPVVQKSQRNKTCRQP